MRQQYAQLLVSLFFLRIGHEKHTKEKIITVFYAKQGIQGIKASHAFVFPSKPKFSVLCF